MGLIASARTWVRADRRSFEGRVAKLMIQKDNSNKMKRVVLSCCDGIESRLLPASPQRSWLWILIPDRVKLLSSVSFGKVVK